MYKIYRNIPQNPINIKKYTKINKYIYALYIKISYKRKTYQKNTKYNKEVQQYIQKYTINIT